MQNLDIWNAPFDMTSRIFFAQALQQSFKGDLTSFQGMLNYERSLRSAMGKLKNKWPTGLKVPKSMMLHNFVPEEEAPDAEGWDPANPNGFGAGPADEQNPSGVPGYTYTTNGEDVGVDDEGPGYYQVPALYSLLALSYPFLRGSLHD